MALPTRLHAFPQNPSLLRGSTATPSFLTPKCRCGPVALPVFPIKEIF